MDDSAALDKDALKKIGAMCLAASALLDDLEPGDWFFTDELKDHPGLGKVSMHILIPKTEEAVERYAKAFGRVSSTLPTPLDGDF